MTQNDGAFDQEQFVIQELLIKIWKFLVTTDGVKSAFEENTSYIYEDIEEIESATGIVYEHADLLPDIGHKLTFTSEGGWFNKLLISNNSVQTYEVILQGEISPDDGNFTSVLTEDCILDVLLAPMIEEQEILKFYGRMKELVEHSTREHIKKYSIEVKCSTISYIKECSDSEFKKSIEMLKSNGDPNALF